MKNINTLLFVLTGLCIFSCNNETKPETAEKMILFSKLSGKWIARADSNQYIEIWSGINDSLYTSTGIMLKGADTLFSENVDIKYGKFQKQYIPKVNNQNEGEPVVFEITSITDSSFIAENPTHDFPQKIVYALKTDSLIAYIEGKNREGKLKRQYFRMSRK